MRNVFWYILYKMFLLVRLLYRLGYFLGEPGYLFHLGSLLDLIVRSTCVLYIFYYINEDKC